MIEQQHLPSQNNNPEQPFIKVGFPLQGKTLPADHGYQLYAAIVRQLPSLHRVGWLGVELVSGVPWDKGMIRLPDRSAALHLRLPADRFGAVLALAGKRLDIGGNLLRLGIPVARPLLPAASLYARIVTLKNHTEADTFLPAATRELEQRLGIVAPLELPRETTDGTHPPTRARRIVTIHGKRVVGFSVAVHNLSDADSLKLQTHGLGGRRTMGCGHFNPIIAGKIARGDENEI